MRRRALYSSQALRRSAIGSTPLVDEGSATWTMPSRSSSSTHGPGAEIPYDSTPSAKGAVNCGSSR